MITFDYLLAVLLPDHDLAQSDPAMAMEADGDIVVAWQSGYQDGSGYGIYARCYNHTKDLS